METNIKSPDSAYRNMNEVSYGTHAVMVHAEHAGNCHNRGDVVRAAFRGNAKTAFSFLKAANGILAPRPLD